MAEQRFDGVSRRHALQVAGLAGAATLLATPNGLATPAGAATPGRSTKRTSGREVAVLGGGMAGLTAAHELAERGFAVTVYEPTAFGGKSRSMSAPGTGVGGRMDLPGEHGFRFFPGFYQHIPDTMRRIPFPGNENGVEDNLVVAPRIRMARQNGPDLSLTTPTEPDPGYLGDLDALRQTLFATLNLGLNIPPHELAYYVERLLVFMTSSQQRRFGQWDYVSWMDFVAAQGKSEDYRRVLVRGATSTVVAAKEDVASARTIGTMGEAVVLNLLGQGGYEAPDRLLNAPTNEAWIDPWVRQLRGMGVRFVLGQAVRELEVSGGRVVRARTVDRSGRAREVAADWFVCAMPVERARPLWSAELLRLDPQLERMNKLYVDWMVGIQYYLRRPTPVTRGHVIYFDTPWALTSIGQAQFWPGHDFAADYGDGNVRDCLSVDISDWDTPGMLYGKTAKRCTKDEIVREVWAQLKASLNDEGKPVLRDEDLYSYFLDPAIKWSATGETSNDTPLLVNTVGSWVQRPAARTAIPNLFLAGDYVRTNIDLATMEGANESARAAVNALLEAADSSAPPCAMYRLYQPPELEGLRRLDERRYAAGKPHLLDVG